MTRTQSQRGSTGVSPTARQMRNADRARADIIIAATAEFADHGMGGARIDRIAEQTRTSKTLIYYYFGGKVGLYRAVLERACAGLANIDGTVIDNLSPVAAMSRLVEQTFDHHHAHPAFVRLLMNENIVRANQVGAFDIVRTGITCAVARLGGLLSQGARQGVFRADLDPLQLYLSIGALAFHNVSSRHTVSGLVGYDIGGIEAVKQRRAVVVDMVLRWCSSDGHCQANVARGAGAGSGRACPAVPEPNRHRRSFGTTPRPR